MAVYNAKTNWNNEEKYLNNLISQGGGNAAWAQNQMKELSAEKAKHTSPGTPATGSSSASSSVSKGSSGGSKNSASSASSPSYPSSGGYYTSAAPLPGETTPPKVQTGTQVNQGNKNNYVYVPMLVDKGYKDPVTGATNMLGPQVGWGTVPTGGYYSTDPDGSSWYTVNGQSYNMSAGVGGTNASGTRWSQADKNLAMNGSGGNNVTGQAADPYATANQYTNNQYNAYTQAQADAAAKAAQEAAAVQAQLEAARLAAEEAAAKKRDANLALIDRQIAGLGTQESRLRGQAYNDSRVSAIQNAERTAAMGLGGNPYAEANSGYAENVRLREDAALRGQLGSISQNSVDAQRELETMRTNAAILGEGEINQVSSDWMAKIAEMAYQQSRDATADAFQSWQMSQTEQNTAFEQDLAIRQLKIQQQQQAADNAFRAAAMQTGIDQYSAEQTIANAQRLAEYGDFSGYRAMGTDTTQMEAEWARNVANEEKLLAYQTRPRSSGSGELSYTPEAFTAGSGYSGNTGAISAQPGGTYANRNQYVPYDKTGSGSYLLSQNNATNGLNLINNAGNADQTAQTLLNAYNSATSEAMRQSVMDMIYRMGLESYFTGL